MRRGRHRRETVERVASQVGLDTAGLKKALDNKTYAARVDADAKMGADVGVEGTPAVFINGRIVSGAVPIEQFKEVTEKALSQAREMVGGGIIQ